ncbi:MAG: hypothetical protein R3227_10500, partial [Reinekea sp.]|nr:hypothetical protein [Reinekea sp.]
DSTALPKNTLQVIHMDDDQIGIVRRRTVDIYDLQSRPQNIAFEDMSSSQISSSKQGHEHFMLKEILEQPQSVAETLRGRQQFPLERSIERVIGRLIDDESIESEFLCRPQGFNDFPGREHARADVTHLARAHHVVERAHRFLHRRRFVDEVDLVQVDVVGERFQDGQLWRLVKGELAAEPVLVTRLQNAAQGLSVKAAANTSTLAAAER